MAAITIVTRKYTLDAGYLSDWANWFLEMDRRTTRVAVESLATLPPLETLITLVGSKPVRECGII